MSAPYEACGGCGAQTPAERCIGCLHDFGDGPLFPSQTPEAAGLEVVAWRSSWTGLTGRVVHALHEKKAEAILNAKWMEDAAFEPLVTAASAQAAIDAEKAKVAELEALVASYRQTADREARNCDEAEARADRLEKGIVSAKLILTPEPGDSPLTEREKNARQYLAALQQETQP